MTRGRTSRSSPVAIAAAEAQKTREDDIRIKNFLDDYISIIEEKVNINKRFPAVVFRGYHGSIIQFSLK